MGGKRGQPNNTQTISLRRRSTRWRSDRRPDIRARENQGFAPSWLTSLAGIRKVLAFDEQTERLDQQDGTRVGGLMQERQQNEIQGGPMLQAKR